jgi:hypothetical protein
MVRERIVMHCDSELGLVPVRIADTDHFWYWITASALIGALCGTALVISIIHRHASAPSLTPIIEDHK